VDRLIANDVINGHSERRRTVRRPVKITAAVDALKKNAFDVIVKSFEQVEFNHMIHKSRPDDTIGSQDATAKMIKCCLHRQ
jgi:hypothetical protein